MPTTRVVLPLWLAVFSTVGIYETIHWWPITDTAKFSHGAAIEKPERVTSCGPRWMAITDHYIQTNSSGIIRRRGYMSAIEDFCNKAGGQAVGDNLYLSMATRIWLNYGADPLTTGTNGYVYFEIHNNKNNEHFVDGKTYELQHWHTDMRANLEQRRSVKIILITFPRKGGNVTGSRIGIPKEAHTRSTVTKMFPTAQ